MSSYDAWRQRLTTPPSPKRQSVAALIRACYFEHRRRYGARRIQSALQQAGTKVGRWQIRRVMREQQLRARQPKSFRPRTTDATGVPAAPNLVRTLPPPTTAGQVLVGDITDLPVRQGRWDYLAMWQDRLTRRIVGWSVVPTMSAALVTTALCKAWQQGLVQPGAIIHSDRGSQYASHEFRQFLLWHQLRQRMSGNGNCYDNAQAKSFFARCKTELLEGGIFTDIEEARSELFSHIEGDYNRVRLHSSLGYRTPLAFEQALQQKQMKEEDNF